jgi:hypothetical protein
MIYSRFWSKVQITDGCWLWAGGKTRSGYGGFWLNNRTLPAHRVAWELTNGPIPEGLFACHKCDVRACVNPGHLFLGTQLDNMRDKLAKGRVGECAPKNPAKGARNHNAKITDAIALGIRAASGSHRSIGERFGVSRSSVTLIRARKQWKHI